MNESWDSLQSFNLNLHESGGIKSRSKQICYVEWKIFDKIDKT